MDRWRRALFSQGEGQREKREDTYKDNVNNEVALMSKEKNKKQKQRGDGVVEKIPEDALGGQQKDEKEPQKTDNKQRDSQTPGAVEGKGESPGEGWENQKRETSRKHRYEGDANNMSELHGEDGHPRPQQRIQNLKDQPDSSETGQQGAPRCCGCTEAPAERAVLVQRQPVRRTDEAVWAAAALGFLLVLLALSVLHTRLYRHWRTMPSLYWHHPQNDYDSVAGEISNMEDEISHLASEISSMAGQISSVAGEVSCVAGEIGCVPDEISCVAGEISSMAGEISNITGEPV